MNLMKIAKKWLTPIVLTMALIITTGVSCATATPGYVISYNPKNPIKGIFTEGPHVIYKKGKVWVKKVHFSSGKTELQVQSFENKEDLPPLLCTVDDKNNTTFEVKIRSEHQSPATVYPQPKKLFAISDIEGNFEAFAKSLKGNGIVDNNLNWKYGKGHLVLVGDFFDRGYNVTSVLWLIYKLDQEAKEAGGMVHFIVGNHEEMNMRGDVRYVKPRYIKAAKVMGINYAGLYSSNTELGRWLRSKNVIEKVGKTIFVHGGLSPQMANSRVRLEDMNKYAHKYYGMGKFRMEQKGGIANAVFDKDGPMWYRGYFKEQLSDQEVKNILDLYGAKRVVVGHTIVPNVSSLFGGKVIAIDVKHDIALSNNITNAIVFEDDSFFAVNISGQKNMLEEFMTEDIVMGTFQAIKTGNVPVVKHFLESGGSRVNKYYFGKRVTLLQEAIRHGQVDMVKYLIEQGADINMLSQNMTPLMFSIQVNNSHIMDMLIKEGANINALNKQKKSSLFYCAKYGDIEIAQYLIENGAKITQKDRKGRTAAQYAQECKNKKVALYLSNLK